MYTKHTHQGTNTACYAMQSHSLALTTAVVRAAHRGRESYCEHQIRLQCGQHRQHRRCWLALGCCGPVANRCPHPHQSRQSPAAGCDQVWVFSLHHHPGHHACHCWGTPHRAGWDHVVPGPLQRLHVLCKQTMVRMVFTCASLSDPDRVYRFQ